MFFSVKRILGGACVVGVVFSVAAFLCGPSAAQTVSSKESVRIGALTYINYTYPDGSNKVVRDTCATDDSMVIEVRKDTQSIGYYQYIYADGSYCIKDQTPSSALSKLLTDEPVSDGPFEKKSPTTVQYVEQVWVGSVMFQNTVYADGSNSTIQLCGSSVEASKIVAIHKSNTTDGYYQYMYSNGDWCDVPVAPTGAMAMLVDNNPPEDVDLKLKERTVATGYEGGAERAHRDGEPSTPPIVTPTNPPIPGTVDVCSGGFVYPTAITWVSGGNDYTGKGHPGIDFACHLNDPIYAISDGVVVLSQDIPCDGRICGRDSRNHSYGSFGRHVIIRHCSVNGRYISSHYAHMDARMVNVGETVTKGQQIGVCGTTGQSQGTHLHFGLFSCGSNEYSGCSINPSNYGIGNTR